MRVNLSVCCVLVFLASALETWAADDKFVLLKTMNYNDAKAACQALGGRLPIIKSREENDELKSFLRQQISTNRDSQWVRIGLYWKRDKDYEWVDGSPLNGYENFATGEPDRNEEHKSIVFNAEYGIWRTREEDDSSSYRVVCQLDLAADKITDAADESVEFFLEDRSKALSLSDTRRSCGQGTLPMPKTRAVMEQLVLFVKDKDLAGLNGVRLGLNFNPDDRKYYWDDNTPLGNYQPWAPSTGEPNLQDTETNVVFVPSALGWRTRVPRQDKSYSIVCQRQAAKPTVSFELECSSVNYAYTECRPAEGVVMTSAAVKKQNSNAECRLGVSFGLKEQGKVLWVGLGCRAVFSINGDVIHGNDLTTTSTSITHGQCQLMDGSTVDYAKCSATGDPHYRTFDGVAFDFQGACCYSMVKLCQDGGDLPEFEVQVCNDYKGRETSRVSWTRSVSVRVGGVTYVLGRDDFFQINGRDAFVPYTGGGVTVTKERRGRRYEYVLKSVQLCNKITWDGSQNVHIYLNKAYAGLVCGLCGNMNGVQDDDRFAYNGNTRVSSVELGNSYIVPDQTHINNKCSVDVPVAVCDQTKRVAAQNNKYCGYLNPDNNLSPFYQALNAGQSVDAKNALRALYENCLNDRCMEPEPLDDQLEDICEVLQNLNEVIINDMSVVPTGEWRVATGCRLDCSAEPNTELRNDAKSCENTCVNPDAEANCVGSASFPACRCKAGLVRDVQGRCVDQAQCNQCVDVKTQPGNPNSPLTIVPGGAEIVLEPCVLKVKCTKGTAEYVNLQACSMEANCVNNVCVCREGYSGDGFSCVKEAAACKTGWTSSGGKCYKVLDRSLSWELATRTCCAQNAQMARVDTKADLDDLSNFLRQISDTTTDYWVAGNTHIIPLGRRLNSLATSYDGPRFVTLADARLGCYYARSSGNINIHENCQLAMPAVCEYANPALEDEPEEITYEYKLASSWKKYTYTEARQACEQLGAGFALATAKTADEQQKLRAFMRSKSLSQARLDLYWSGNGDVFDWGDGGDTSTGYTSWHRDGSWVEPNNMNNQDKLQRSVIYDTGRDAWSTEKENSRNWKAVCQKKTDTRTEAPLYLPLNTGGAKVTFYKAKELCAKEGRMLPVIKTMSELEDITGITQLSDVWLDLTDKGANDWRWADGSSVYVDAWDRNEPNNIGTEKCGRLHRNGEVYNLRSSKCGDDGAKWGYVVCGPRSRDMPHVWSPFIEIGDATKRTIAQVMEVQKSAAILAGRTPFSCSSPLAVDCQAMDRDGNYQSAGKLNPRVLCNSESVQCQDNTALNCATFRVRLFCRNEENLCQSVQELGTNPCEGNQVCVPESNGCFTCRCPPGQTLDHNGNCHQPCGHCRVRGDPHYTTLSGSPYDFQGKCMYLLNGICADVADGDLPAGVLRYTILTKNKECNPNREGVTCLKRIRINLFNVPTTAGKRDFAVDYVSGASDYRVNDQSRTDSYAIRSATGEELFSVRIVSRVFKLDAMGGLYVEASNGHEIRVIPPAALRDEMCGLCGQCTDTYRFGDGSVVAIEKSGSKLNSYKAMLLGNSWMVNDPLNAEEDCEIETEVAPPCSGERKQIAEDMCKIIKDPAGPFSACHATVDPTEFYDECEFDVCEDATRDRCEIMAAYVNLCTSKGISLNAWRSAELCPMACGDSMEYSLDINCQTMCGDVLPDCTNLAPTEGCRCQVGYFFMNGRCATEDECGCRVTLTNGIAEISLKPNEEILDTACTQKIKCIPGGRIERTPYTGDRNAICINTEPPTLECARGYTMSENGETCERNIEQCADSFEDVASTCIDISERPRIWRRALEKCNELNAALMRVDIPDKLVDLKAFMILKGIVSAFVTGQVRVTRDGKVEAILAAELQDQVEYNNYAVPDFVFDQGIRTDDISFADLPAGGDVFAVAVVLDASQNLVFVAVPRSAKLNFVCEERPANPEDYEETDFCSGSEPWNVNGEYERASDLVMIDGCEICLYPTSVTCERANPDNMQGRDDGECGYNNGMLYRCDGADCADMKVSGTCPKDVDECAEGLDDCPANSDCINNNGAYICRCRAGFPLMIDNECKSIEMCSMVGTSEPLSFDLHLKPFTADDYGSLNYDCAMSFARTCGDLPDGVPGIDIMVNNERNGNMADQSVTISVNRDGVQTDFYISSTLRKDGKLQVNGLNRAPPMSDGETEVVAQANDGTIVVQDRSQRFKVIVTPGDNGELALLELELSSDYANKMCGLCTMGAADNNRFVLTDADLVDINVGGAGRACVAMTTPRPTTTTTAVITTTMFVPPTVSSVPTTTPEPTTTTTTAAPTTTEDPCANERDMCQRLGTYCQVEETECVRETCLEVGGSMCKYLGRAALNFCRRDAADDLMTFFAQYCTETCSANMQVLRLARVGVNPSCAEPQPDLVGENFLVDLKFQCMCDYEGRAEVQENGQCIPRSQCGCRIGDDYRQAGEVWSALDCSATYECRDGEVITTPRTCSDNSECINRAGELVCECKEGFKGDGNMPDGCKEGIVEEEQTCYEMQPWQVVCYCNEGYAPTCDGCQDINECAINTALCSSDKQRCENTEGSYRCVCRDGYRMDANNNCVDQNECMQVPNPCPDNSQCINLPGGYSCQCCAGYDATAIGTCARNEGRVPDAWLALSLSVGGRSQCCAPCPYPQCINPASGPINGCYENADGTFTAYAEFRFLYEEYCLKRLVASINIGRWSYGNCPAEATVGTEAPAASPAQTSAGTPPPSPPPARGCSRDNMCGPDNVPSDFNNNEQVCGPSGDPNQQTYPSYCAMLIALCNVNGGPDNYSPPSDLSADKGACPTPATTSPAPVTTAMSAPPDFGDWGPWSECTSIEANKNCGPGVIARSRQVLPTSPADRRDALESELYQTDGCFLGPCPTEAPDPADPSPPMPPRCPDFSICNSARDPVCGQIGSERPRTYSSQCMFDLLACERDEPKVFLYSGDCQPDDSNPKLYCDQAPRKVPIDITAPGDASCKAIAVEIATCGDRLCRNTNLSSSACCVPDGEEQVSVTYVCDNGSMFDGVVMSATSCQCEEPGNAR